MSSTQEAGDIFGKGSGPAHAMLRSPTVLIAAVGLWGMNIYFFRLFGIDYVKVLKYDLFKLANEEIDRHTNYYNHQQQQQQEQQEQQQQNEHQQQQQAQQQQVESVMNASIGSEDSSGNDEYDSDQDDDVKNCNNNNGSSNSIKEHTELIREDSMEDRFVQSNVTTIRRLGKNHKKYSTTKNIKNMNGNTGSSSTTNLSIRRIRVSSSGSFVASDPNGSDDESNENNTTNFLQHNSSYDDIESSIMEAGGGNSNTEKHSLVLSSTNNNATNHNIITSYTSVTWFRLVTLSMILLFLLHSTYFIWIDMLHGGTIGAILCFYSVVTIFILFPIKSTKWLRKSANIIIIRIFELITIRCWCCRITDHNVKLLPNGPRSIPFIDVFFADAMCSLSKVFFDWGMLLHMAYYYPKPVPSSTYNILIPSIFASIPYFIRARQCLIMYSITTIKNDSGRFQHLWNALKYSTSIFPLILSAYQQTIRPNISKQLDKYLIVLLIINAGYSLFWDIVMDWGMMKNPTAALPPMCGVTQSTSTTNTMSSSGPNANTVIGKTSGNSSSGAGRALSQQSCWYILLRQRLRFGVAMSVIILLTDAILRFSWTLRFIDNSKIFPSNNSFVLCTQFLEIFRRAIWNLLRVEWENIKQTAAGSSTSTTSTISPITTSSNNPTNNTNNLLHMTTTNHHHHHPSIINRHHSGNMLSGSIELAPSVGNKDDDEKMKLLVQRSLGVTINSKVVNKVKP